MADFPATTRTRIKRVNERARYDTETVYTVLDAGLMCTVAYVIDGQPYATPTLYWRDGDTLYWHGSSASRMIRKVAEDGIPACLTVAHLDGLVLARSAFHMSVNYRSVMVFGEASLIEEEAEKLAAVEAFLDHVVPRHRLHVREPNSQELKATSVLAMKIDEAVAKIRTGPPKDDDSDMDRDVWAGVVPVNAQFGAPVPDPALAGGIDLPDYVKNLR